MLEIHTNKIDGKPRRVNLHDLPIAGTMAHVLSGRELYRELKKLGVPRIESWMGHQDLSLRYGVWLQQQEEAAQA
jgi:hypothetical protein